MHGIRATLPLAALSALLVVGCGSPSTRESPGEPGAETRGSTMNSDEKVVKSDADWRGELTEEQYRITRCKGTEPSFTGKYWDHKGDGVYRCVCCGQALFDSKTKFDSGSGWPSFYAPLDGETVQTREDRSLAQVRTEVLCSRCDAHLGHVFSDAPGQPTGLRYCINSASLDFAAREADGNQ